MKARTSIAIVSSAGLIGAGAFLLPAAASPSHATHTVKFTSVALKDVSFAKTSQGETDKAIVAGKIIGFALVDSNFDPKTMTGKGGLTVMLKNGFIDATLTFGDSPVTHGTVTGGTGRYKDATGTVVGKNLNKAGTKTAVTITWH
jgi:hypothetical protein